MTRKEWLIQKIKEEDEEALRAYLTCHACMYEDDENCQDHSDLCDGGVKKWLNCPLSECEEIIEKTSQERKGTA